MAEIKRRGLYHEREDRVAPKGRSLEMAGSNGIEDHPRCRTQPVSNQDLTAVLTWE